MLLEFRVKNFRSIRDEIVLSMVASTDETYADANTKPTGIKTVPNVVLSSVIYGANAAGKSTLVEALAFFRIAVARSAQLSPNQGYTVKPFLLDSDWENEPSEFEITFLLEGVRYQYGFALNQNRILEEWLLAYPKSQPQRWFTRKIDDEHQEDSFEFGTKLLGPKKLWRQSTRPNALLLSVAAQLNSKQLTPVLNGIVDMTVIGTAGYLPFDLSVAMLQEESGKRVIQKFMDSADISIASIDLRREEATQLAFTFDLQNNEKIESSTGKAEILVPTFRHETSSGAATLDISVESLGTQRLFALAGHVLVALSKGGILVVDELSTSLHTLLARQLVELFHDPDSNTHGAQLIFTTHDTTLLDSDLFRRDQIWFVEKNESQASVLFPLTDFSPRKNEALGRGYLMGRYGALPFLNGFGDSEEVSGD